MSIPEIAGFECATCHHHFKAHPMTQDPCPKCGSFDLYEYDIGEWEEPEVPEEKRKGEM
jgi:Zn finger protein HypA/HybF involved in hydrogenase expression